MRSRTRRPRPVRPDPSLVPPLSAAAQLHLWTTR